LHKKKAAPTVIRRTAGKRGAGILIMGGAGLRLADERADYRTTQAADRREGSGECEPTTLRHPGKKKPALRTLGGAQRGLEEETEKSITAWRTGSACGRLAGRTSSAPSCEDHGSAGRRPSARRAAPGRSP